MKECIRFTIRWLLLLALPLLTMLMLPLLTLLLFRLRCC